MKRYPDYPGHGGGDTSREAADSMAPHVNRLQAIALGAIHGAGDSGLTREEVSGTLGIDPAAIQPRVSELKRKGLIVDSGPRRFNRSGKRAIVWIVVSHLNDPAVSPYRRPQEE